MSRYVSVDFIINECEEFDFDGDVVKSISGNTAPSVDIVRCKECKHWHKKDKLTYCDRIDYGYGYKADDFCSYGERRG